ncbi:hypothetical protein DITRI_Ditri18aG0104100 [Diplodiscus trichospermus]
MTTRIAPEVGANLLGQHSAERNQDATAYVGNLDPQSDELASRIWICRVSKRRRCSDYAIKVLNMIKLYGKPIRANKDVDEKLLYDTFSAFGVIVTNPKILRDPESGNSRGFGLISYDSFEASGVAIEEMNGQYLCNRQISVSYAYQKDTKGEPHGTPAERVLAASNPNAQKSRPHTLFASGPPTLPTGPLANGAVGAPHTGQSPWQSQPQQPGQPIPPQVMPPPMQFRPPPPNMPPPPPQSTLSRTPPPMGMGAPPVWPPPPHPQQMG